MTLLATQAQSLTMSAGKALPTPFWLLLLGIAPIVAAMGPRALSFVPGFILALGIASYFWSTRKRPLLSPTPLIYMGAVSALCLISVLWSVNMHDAIDRAAKIALVVMGNGLLLSYILARPIERLKFFPLTFLSAFITGLVLLASELYFNGPITTFANGLLGESNDFKYSDLNRGIVALVLCTPAALALAGFTITDTFKRRAVYGIIFALLGLMCFLTFSQSAHLALVVMAFFFFLFPVGREWAWLALALTLSALIFATPFMVQFFFQALPPIILGVSWFEHSYALERLEIWDYVSRYAMQQPLTGWGVEATRMVTFDTKELYQGGNTVLHPHNFAVQIWMEFGALGATLGSLFLLHLLDAIRKLPDLPARVCLASMMGSLAVASTGYGIWQGWWLGTFILITAYCMLVAKIFAARVSAPAAAKKPAPVVAPAVKKAPAAKAKPKAKAAPKPKAKAKAAPKPAAKKAPMKKAAPKKTAVKAKAKPRAEPKAKSKG